MVFVILPTSQMFLHGLLHKKRGFFGRQICLKLFSSKNDTVKLERKRSNNLMAKVSVDFHNRCAPASCRGFKMATDTEETKGTLKNKQKDCPHSRGDPRTPPHTISPLILP